VESAGALPSEESSDRAAMTITGLRPRREISPEGIAVEVLHAPSLHRVLHKRSDVETRGAAASP
jgi:hypothetical protein